MSEFVPNGFSDVDMEKVLEAVNGGKYDGRGWRGVFGGVEMVLLTAFAKGDIDAHRLIVIFGEGGALDMLALWRDDIKTGVVEENHLLDSNLTSLDLFKEVVNGFHSVIKEE